MTKSELIRALSHLDDSAEILVEVPSGDYWGRMLAAPINRLEEVPVTHSDYHNATQIVSPEYADETDVKYAFVLR